MTMQTFLVTVLTFLSAAIYGPEEKLTDPVDTETSVNKEASNPELEDNSIELETC